MSETKFTEAEKLKLKKIIKTKLAESSDLLEILKAVNYSSSYTDAYEYAHILSGCISEAVNELGIDEWLFGSAIEIMEPSFKDMHADINTVCEVIQSNKNQADGIGIKPQRVKYDIGDVKDTLAKIVENSLDIPTEIETYADRVVDNIQKRNVDFMLNSGSLIVVTRQYDGVGLRKGTKHAEDCQWCKSKAGIYTFDTTRAAADSGVFLRHSGCGCTIDYKRKSRI